MSSQATEFVDVPGYEDIYEVSRCGKFRNKITGHLLTLSRNKSGHISVEFWRKGKRKRLYVHRVIATVFMPNPAGLPVINHIDGDPSNNDLSNLEWCTRSHNSKHAYLNGSLPSPYKGPGVLSPASKLTDDDIREIRRRRDQGETCKSISDDYPVCSSNIMQICARKTWRHV